MPSSEDWGSEAMDGGRANQGTRQRSRTPVWRTKDGEDEASGTVRVPRSWEEPRAEVPEGRVDQPKTSSEEADSLQREVEFEMIMFLREQNSRLMAKVQALSKGKGTR